MNNNYYPIDFQAQYEETSQKMIEISKRYKDTILTKQPLPIDKIQSDLETIQNQIEDQGLQFRKQSIYSQFASGQLMAERRKQPPQMCPECGQQLKKQVQCQFCAEVFCRKCCSRNRIIPFVSKQFRLCCEQCHWKFVKLFDNKQFYEQKQKIINVITFVRNKTNKIVEKLTAKMAVVQEYKNEKRNEKIKQKNLQNKVLQEQKKLKQLEDDFRRIVSEKAEKIKLDDQRRRLEEQERQKNKKIELERLEREQIERKRKQQEEQEQRKKKIKEEEEKKRNEESLKQNQKKTVLQLQADKQKRKKQEKQKQQRELLRLKDEEMRKKDQQIQELRKQLQMKTNEEKIRKKSGDSISSKKQSSAQITPKQSLGKSGLEKQKQPDTATSQSNIGKSRKESEDMSLNGELLSKKSADSSLPNGIPKLQNSKSTKEEKTKTEPIEKVQLEAKAVEAEPESSLQRSLANMLRLKKDDDSKSMVSSASKQSKKFMDMSVNELLGARVPMVRTNSKIQNLDPAPEAAINQEESGETEARFQDQQIVFSPRRPTERMSLKVAQVVEQPAINKEQLQITRNSIIRNSSLMSSTNKQTSGAGETDAPNKCACAIM